MWINPHMGARWGVLWEEGAHITLLKSKRTSYFRNLYSRIWPGHPRPGQAMNASPSHRGRADISELDFCMCIRYSENIFRASLFAAAMVSVKLTLLAIVVLALVQAHAADEHRHVPSNERHTQAKDSAIPVRCGKQVKWQRCPSQNLRIAASC